MIHQPTVNSLHKEKDLKSLQSMLKMDLKRLREDLATPQADRRVAAATVERKEMENLEVVGGVAVETTIRLLPLLLFHYHQYHHHHH